MRDANEAGGAPTDIMQQAIQKILKTLKADEFLALMQDPGAIARGVRGGGPEGPMAAQPLTQDMAPHPGYTPQGGMGGGMAGKGTMDGKSAKLKALYNILGTGGAGPK